MRFSRPSAIGIALCVLLATNFFYSNLQEGYYKLTSGERGHLLDVSGRALIAFDGPASHNGTSTNNKMPYGGLIFYSGGGESDRGNVDHDGMSSSYSFGTAEFR